MNTAVCCCSDHKDLTLHMCTKIEGLKCIAVQLELLYKPN